MGLAGAPRGWLEGAAHAGPVAYVAATALLALPPVPGASAVMCTLGGAAYGAVGGTLLFTAASTLGALLALLVARALVRAPLHRCLSAHAHTLKALDAAVEDEAFQIVALLRLSPFVPFGLATLLLAQTSVPVDKFIAGTFLGLIPSSLPYAYAGALARHTGGEAASDGQGGGRSRLSTAVLVVGLAATVLVSWRITMVARRALAAAIGGQEAAAAVGGAGDGGSVQLLAQQQRTKGV